MDNPYQPPADAASRQSQAFWRAGRGWCLLLATVAGAVVLLSFGSWLEVQSEAAFHTREKLAIYLRQHQQLWNTAGIAMAIVLALACYFHIRLLLERRSAPGNATVGGSPARKP
ncbi:MAG: hypothetical protein KDB14_12450 [Planctomycetales bacterium]|nr:hypothetical protein [Planctomycetales bacterium]